MEKVNLSNADKKQFSVYYGGCWSTNIGNAFIDYGALHLMKQSNPLFYSYFWIKNQGQTLGMQAWRIKLVTAENKNITLKDSIKRCFFSIILFPGYLWILIDKDKLSWADILSNTKIVNLSKN